METSPDAALASSSPEEEEAEEKSHGEAAEQQQQQEVEDEAAPVVLKKGPWTTAEDAMLVDHVRRHGEGNWNAVQRLTGLLRCGKSCRLRWTNHLRPNLKKGSFSPDEELLIAQLHAQLGNKWARMAAHLPGRTDNEIKNYWNTRTKRRQRAGLPVYPPEVQLQLALSTKRFRRYDDLSPLDAASSAAGYTSSRPAPLDLARQLAATNQMVHFLSSPAPAAFSSAPPSPWVKPPFARNAHYFGQFAAAHSSPVSPSTPDLSLGCYGGLRGGGGGAQSRLAPPLSPSPAAGPRVELPSNQFGQAPTSAAAAAAAAALAGGAAALPDQQQQNGAESLEKMLQELQDAIKVELPPASGGAVMERHGGGRENNPGGQRRADDMDTLFDMMIPTLNAPAAAPTNHSGSTSQHSSDDQEPSTVDLQLAGAASSSEQDWGLDGVCHWSNISRIC